MPGIPGGRGPRAPQDYGEWLDQRLKNENFLSVSFTTVRKGTGTVAAKAGDFLYFEGPATVVLPKASISAQKPIKIRTALVDELRITVTPSGGDTIDGDATSIVGGYGGSLELISNGIDMWHRIGGDQNIAFEIFRSGSINSYDVGDAAYIYFDATTANPALLFDGAAAAATTQGQFTAPETGLYQFGGRVEADDFSTGQTFTTSITVNGTAIRTSDIEVTYAGGIVLGTNVEAGPYFLRKGDLVALDATASAGAHTLNGGAAITYFWGRKLPN